MSEKTPRQVGIQAEALYAKHKNVAPELALVNEVVERNISDVQRFHNQANAVESGKVAPEFEELTPEEDAQRRRGMRDITMGRLGKSILRQGELAEESDANLREATRHYEENAAAYHQLGVHEAALDGVHINVQQPNDAEEQSDNK